MRTVLKALALCLVLVAMVSHVAIADWAAAPVRGGAKTPVSHGAGRAAKQGTPNSIYEQVDGAGDVRSRTFYDENGRSFSRQDCDHPHGGVQPHEAGGVAVCHACSAGMRGRQVVTVGTP